MVLWCLPPRPPPPPLYHTDSPPQIIGARGSDSLTIAAASIVSKALGGWVPPTIAGIPPKASAR